MQHVLRRDDGVTGHNFVNLIRSFPIINKPSQQQFTTMTRRLRSEHEVNASPLQSELPKAKPRGRNARKLYTSSENMSSSSSAETTMRASEVAAEHAQPASEIVAVMERQGRSSELDEGGCYGVAPSYLARFTNDRNPRLPHLLGSHQKKLLEVFNPQKDVAATISNLLANPSINSAFQLTRTRIGGLWLRHSTTQTTQRDFLCFAAEYVTDRTLFRQLLVDQSEQLEQNRTQMSQLQASNRRDSETIDNLERRVVDQEDTVRQVIASTSDSSNGKNLVHWFSVNSNIETGPSRATAPLSINDVNYPMTSLSSKRRFEARGDNEPDSYEPVAKIPRAYSTRDKRDAPRRALSIHSTMRQAQQPDDYKLRRVCPFHHRRSA